MEAGCCVKSPADWSRYRSSPSWVVQVQCVPMSCLKWDCVWTQACHIPILQSSLLVPLDIKPPPSIVQRGIEDVVGRYSRNLGEVSWFKSKTKQANKRKQLKIWEIISILDIEFPKLSWQMLTISVGHKGKTTELKPRCANWINKDRIFIVTHINA